MFRFALYMEHYTKYKTEIITVTFGKINIIYENNIIMYVVYN